MKKTRPLKYRSIHTHHTTLSGLRVGWLTGPKAFVEGPFRMWNELTIQFPCTFPVSIKGVVTDRSIPYARIKSSLNDPPAGPAFQLLATTDT